MSLMNVLHFNELSRTPISACKKDADCVVSCLAETLKAAREEGFRIIRCDDDGISGISLAEDYSRGDFCLKNLRSNEATLILSMFRPPYYESKSDEEKRYIESAFSVDVPKELHPEGVMEACGLSAAAMHDAICLSLATHDFWKLNKILHVREKGRNGLNRHKVYNFSSPADFIRADHYLKWCLDHIKEDFLDCGIAPEKKMCSLSSDHHGNDELKKFAKQSLFKLPYIIGVVTSIAYTHNADRFVKSIQYKKNGEHPTRLEVVLWKSEHGYGMVVETTARNEFELLQIAYKLEKLFGPHDSYNKCSYVLCKGKVQHTEDLD